MYQNQTFVDHFSLGNRPWAHTTYTYSQRCACVRHAYEREEEELPNEKEKDTVPNHLAPSLSSPHLFVKPSTFSLLLNCFSPSSLRLSLSLIFLLSSQWLQCTHADRQTNFRRIESHSRPGHLNQLIAGETQDFGLVSAGRPERHGRGGCCGTQEEEEFLGDYFRSTPSLRVLG